MSGGGAAVIVAAGRGERAGAGAPKAYREIGGVSLLRRTLEVFATRREIAQVVVVIAPEHVGFYEGAVQGVDRPPQVVMGGAKRTQSVRAGLEALAKSPPDFVLIHDAARPFVNDAVIAAVEAGLLTADGAVPALEPADAVKRLEPGDLIGRDEERRALRAVQTPQAFWFEKLLKAYRALPADADLPDDAAVAREAGLIVSAAPGDPENWKLTFPGDFARAERRLASSSTRFAAGHGFDAHRVGPGDGVRLCGVRVPAEFALVGHSDADVGLHAITDAILGAVGAGDIGEHFPPGDPQWKGADSRQFLAHARALAAQTGARVTHVDVTLICERPRIAPHRDAMRAAIAEILGLAIERVSVKATTTERLGFLGRGEGLAALATATVAWT